MTSDAVLIISAGVVANELAEGSLVALPFDNAMTMGPVGFMTRPGGQPSPATQVFHLALDAAVATLRL